MKSEYLITFDCENRICTSSEKFINLIATHEFISFVEKDKVTFKGKDFPYQLAKGNLIDGSIYYDLTIENPDLSDQKLYKDLLRHVKKICFDASNRKIILLNDDIGEYYCQQGYPIIYKTENLMRKLIAKFMAIGIGYKWSDTSVPKEVLDSFRGSEKIEKSNFLHEVDFIQLSNFLFKKYTTNNSIDYIESLKGKTDEEFIRVGDLRQCAPFTNWERYFSEKVECNSDYIKSKWDRLYILRCKIAHCKGITEQEYIELSKISNDVCEKINTALDSIDDIHIEEAEREELAENFSGIVNKRIEEFLVKYNELASLVKNVCDMTLIGKDKYEKSNIIFKDIISQVNYLCAEKNLITVLTAEQISETWSFKDDLVHNVWTSEISDDSFDFMISSINDHIELFSSFKKENLLPIKTDRSE